MEYIQIKATIYIIIFMLGAAVGSFLNVCIFRIPAHENIVSKRSRCMQCGNVLKWYELIPLLSFCMQRGKCRHCRCRLSFQYPFIELANGILFVWITAVKGFHLTSLLYCLCASVLIVISVIDIRTMEIPFGLNLCIFFLGIVMLLSDLEHWHEYFIGFFAVSGFFFLLRLLTRGRGMGGGDIKLMAAAGLLLGWKNIVLAMVIGCITGSCIHLFLMKAVKKDRVLAFGPYLSWGIAAVMLYGDRILNWYLELLGI